MDNTLISTLPASEQVLEFMEIDLSSIENALNPEVPLVNSFSLQADKPY